MNELIGFNAKQSVVRPAIVHTHNYRKDALKEEMYSHPCRLEGGSEVL